MRGVTDQERQIMGRLLSVDFDGADVLRAQTQAIREVESNCTCGCPSITTHVDRAFVPSVDRRSSVLPVELMEMSRAYGVPRTVLCFMDEDGYLADLECVYYDDAVPEWPDPHNCAVCLRDGWGHLEAVGLPSGVIVRPYQSGDRWVSFEVQDEGGFCAATSNGYRECYTADGTALCRLFTQ